MAMATARVTVLATAAMDPKMVPAMAREIALLLLFQLQPTNYWPVAAMAMAAVMVAMVRVTVPAMDPETVAEDRAMELVPA
jgi:hypothetical protein